MKNRNKYRVVLISSLALVAIGLTSLSTSVQAVEATSVQNSHSSSNLAELSNVSSDRSDPHSTASSGVITVTAVITSLPGGGSLYTYNDPDGSVDQVPVPPADFDPSTASAAELATYDFPARPTQPGPLASWESAMQAYRTTEVPSTTIEYSESSTTTPDPGTLAYSGNWGGYYAGTYEADTPTYVAVEGEAVAPDMVSDECAVGSTNIQAAIWVGLGGSSASSPGLVQQGVAWCNPDLGGSADWVPVMEFASVGPPRYFCDDETWTIPQGDTVYNDMSYSQSDSDASFFLEDITTGDDLSCTKSPPGGWSFDGSTSDWITEQVDPSSYGLAHYDTFSFGDDYAELNSTGDWVTLGSQSNTSLTTGCSATQYTQDPGSISSDTAFTQYWHAYRYSC